MYEPANEVAKSKEEGEDAALRMIEEHGDIAKEHVDEEVEVGGEAEGEVGEGDANDGGVEVLGEAAGEEAQRKLRGTMAAKQRRKQSMGIETPMEATIESTNFLLFLIMSSSDIFMAVDMFAGSELGFIRIIAMKRGEKRSSGDLFP